MGDSQALVPADGHLQEVKIQHINLSLCSKGSELMTLYWNNIIFKSNTTETEKKVELVLGNFQIDNQSEIDPIYPVLLQPTQITAMSRQD